MFSESFEDAFVRRFGEEPTGSPIETYFLRHRSVRDYSDKPVPESLVRSLVAAAQSSATSSNLQLWSVISVEDPDLREQIALTAGDQRQIRNAPWFFAFIADHCRLRSAAARVNESATGLDFVEFYTMAIIDVALAAERMVCAAESVGLGICYIGAMRNDPVKISELFELPAGTFCPFGLCLGYPAEGATSQIKPRIRQDNVWFRNTYRANVDIREYDERMTKFYESEGMKGEVTWSMRSGRRVDDFHLTGREVLKNWLTTQGFNKR